MTDFTTCITSIEINRIGMRNLFCVSSKHFNIQVLHFMLWACIHPFIIQYWISLLCIWIFWNIIVWQKESSIHKEILMMKWSLACLIFQVLIEAIQHTSLGQHAFLHLIKSIFIGWRSNNFFISHVLQLSLTSLNKWSFWMKALGPLLLGVVSRPQLNIV